MAEHGGESTVGVPAEGLGQELEELEDITPDVVFVIFGMLLLGIVTRHLFARLPLPYTVLLLVWGLIAGATSAIAANNHSGWHVVNVGIEAIAGIHPNALLLIFMPILIYGSAQAMDWHTVKKEFAQVFIMATSGVIVSMCLTACYVKVIPLGWNWFESFMFGALISATDPVAVVALLKDVGASKRLGTIIEGESLLNDGSAFVLFLIFKEYARFGSCCDEGGVTPAEARQGCVEFLENQCDPFTVPEAVELFLKLAVGGPLSGIMFGLVMVLWLSYTYNDEIVEIFITITGAYITFFISEDIFGVSGVLAVVSLGFFMAAVGNSKISPGVQHPLHTVWEMLEWGGNTIIFLLAGIIITQEIVEANDMNSADITADAVGLSAGEAIGWGISIYVVCVVIRFISIAIHFPVLRLIGYGMTWQEAIVISWSGLRGAIGLALALLVSLDQALEYRIRYEVLLFTSVVVILTLVINGSTTKLLLTQLGILKPNPVKQEFLLHSINEMEDYADKHCSHLKHDTLVGDPDWEKVLRISAVDASSLLDREFIKQRMLNEAGDPNPLGNGEDQNLGKKKHKTGKSEPDVAALGITNSLHPEATPGISEDLESQPQKSNRNVIGGMKQVDVLKDVRARLLHGIKATYGEGFHKGYITPSQSLDLISVVDTSLDHLDNAIRDWELLEPHARIHAAVAHLQTREDKICFGPMKKFPRSLLFDGIENGVVLANSYVYAHKTTRERLQAVFYEADENDSIDAETRRLALSAVEIVIQESADGCKKAVKFIKHLRMSFPEVTRAVKTKLVALTVLHRKGKFVDHLFEGGLIEQKDYDALSTAIIKKSMKLQLGGWDTNDVPQPKDMMYNHSMFSTMSREAFDKEVLPKAHHCVFRDKEHLFRRGDSPTSFFIIIRGSTTSVKDEDSLGQADHADHHTSLVGMSEMLLAVPRMRTVTANGLVEGYEFKIEQFAELMGNYSTIEKVAWKQCACTLASYKEEDFVKTLSPEERLDWFMRAEVYLPGKEEDVHITGLTYFAYGQMTSVITGRQIGVRESQKYDAPKSLGPEFMHLRVNSPYAVLLSMPSLAVSRTDTGRDQSILRTMSMQPGARNGRNVLNSASYDSTRIGKHRDAGNMFSRMSMRAVEYAGHNESQAMRMGQGRRSVDMHPEAHANPEQRTRDMLNRLSHTVKDVHFGDQQSCTIEEEPGTSGHDPEAQ
eukprot:jgi/Tetstr1/455358/TSEL_042192.t1